MRLLTHNLLTSKCVKGVNVGYPLVIRPKEVNEIKAAFNSEFVTRILPKLDWKVVYEAASSVGHSDGLPVLVPANYENDEDFLKKAHHVLVEIDVVNADLVCPETGRVFPVRNGIPNMLVNEDEV